GHSVRLLQEELVALYDAFATGRPASLPAVSMRYGEAMASLQTPLDRVQLEYWTRRLADAPALLDLPADRPRPAHQGDAGARLPVLLSKEITDEIERLARAEGCSPFEFLLAVFQTLLSRYTGTTDIV